MYPKSLNLWLVGVLVLHYNVLFRFERLLLYCIITGDCFLILFNCKINIETYQFSAVFSTHLKRSFTIHLRPSRGRCFHRFSRSLTAVQLVRNRRQRAVARINESAKMLRIMVWADLGAFWMFFCITCSQFSTVTSDDIVVACGGFVKSDVEINYSLIEVRVQTSRLVGS